MLYCIVSLLFFIVLGLLGFSSLDNRKFYAIAYCIIVCFWGLSYSYAPDTNGYMEYFDAEVRTLSQGIDINAHGFEPGFNIFASICKSIIPEYVFFQFALFTIEVALVIAGLRKLLTKEQAKFVIVLLFFLYPTMLSATRQGVSIALIIYALQFILKRKFKLYLLLIAVAYTFHHSSLIAVPLLLVYYLEKRFSSNKLLLGILIISDLCWLAGISFSQYLDGVLGTILEDGSGIEKYTMYINDEESAISNYGLAKIIEINIAYCGFIYFRSKQQNPNALFTTFLVLYTIIGMMLGGILAHRFLYYFIIIYYVCVFIGINAIIKRNGDTKYACVSYSLLSVYMFWFYIIKGGMIQNEYIFLPS